MLSTQCPQCGAPTPISLASPYAIRCSSCDYAGRAHPDAERRMLEAIAVLQASDVRNRQVAGLQRTLIGAGKSTTGCMTRALIGLTVVTGVPIGLISAVFLLTILTGWLEKVSWLIAILPLPLSVFVGGVVALLLVRAAVRKLENRCAAIPPSGPGQSATCHVCGAPLAAAGEQAVVRCQYCQADNVVSARALDRARRTRDVVMQDYAQAIRAESLRVPTVSVLGSFGWAAAVLVTMVGSCTGANLYDDYLETVTGPKGADTLLDDVKLSSFGLTGTDVVMCETLGAFTVVPKTGGKRRVLRPKKVNSQCNDPMAMDATHVYWIWAGMLMRMVVDGTREEIVGPMPEMERVRLQLAVDATHVYGTFGPSGADYKSTDGIVKIPKSGGERIHLAEGQRQVGELALDESHVYWFDQADLNSPGFLRRVAKIGGEVETLDQRESLDVTVRPVVDDSFVYVVANFGNAIDRIPKAGGKSQRLARYEASNIEALALDATHLYFATRYDSYGCSGSVYGSVRRLPKAGGTVEVLVEGLKQPKGFALDGTHVYWYDLYRDTMMRIPKQPKR